MEMGSMYVMESEHFIGVVEERLAINSIMGRDICYLVSIALFIASQFAIRSRKEPNYVNVKIFLDEYLPEVIRNPLLSDVPMDTKEFFSRELMKELSNYGNRVPLEILQEHLVDFGYTQRKIYENAKKRT